MSQNSSHGGLEAKQKKVTSPKRSLASSDGVICLDVGLQNCGEKVFDGSGMKSSLDVTVSDVLVEDVVVSLGDSVTSVSMTGVLVIGVTMAGSIVKTVCGG